MIKELSTIRKEIHEKLKTLRSVERILLSIRFEEAWSNAGDDQKLSAQVSLDWANRQSINTWINNNREQQLGEMGFRELYSRARKLHIVNYSKMTKPELLSAIANEENNYEKIGNATGDGVEDREDAPTDRSIRSQE